MNGKDKMKMKRFIHIFFISSFLLCVQDYFITPLYAKEHKTVTDMEGNKIEVPTKPGRIACLYHPAYDKILMLSSVSRIAIIPGDATPWAYKYYPLLKRIQTYKSETIPDVERLLDLKIDLVFYPKGKVNISKVIEAGIPAVSPFDNNVTPTDIYEYMSEFKRQMLFFGDILGEDEKERAERYCRYLDEINSKIMAITSKIPEADKPKVYYGKVTDLYSTQGNNTIMKWYTELSGGIYLPKEIKKYFAEVNREQIIAWDPDIILLGMNGAFGTEKDDTNLKTFRAYKSAKIYNIPAGMFYWDMTSCETALLPLYLGKKFHPDLFKDWDLIKEMKRFYSEIYEIDMTDSDADRISKGMSPL
jgi:iron complex transport system substrate-binding protein